MCRLHRYFLAATAIVWLVEIPLFALAPDHGPMRGLAIIVGCLAAVLLPYCAFPWLVSNMLDEKLKDTTGAFLAGWEAAQEEQGEPDEPARVYAIR